MTLQYTNAVYTQAAVDDAFWRGVIAGGIWALLGVAILYTLVQMVGWRIMVIEIGSRWSQTGGDQ